MNSISEMWRHPPVIAPNNFVNKSLSAWACNTAVGCVHGCRFCYVPAASTIKLGPVLEEYGVTDPDAQWGEYVFPRPWHEEKFRTSLRRAERTPVEQLPADGNRAVMFCSTTDPYQVARGKNPEETAKLNGAILDNMHRALVMIRDESTLNVRILTRSPLAAKHFGLMKTFGNRLLFGMSLPTLNPVLAEIYEPHAPRPAARLAALRKAREAGLHVFVAMAPTPPESTVQDITDTLQAIAELDPVTVFHEPINIRAENVQRIAEHAASLGLPDGFLLSEVFANDGSWRAYAVNQLQEVSFQAKLAGLGERIHLWPDKALTRGPVIPEKKWLESWWERVSEWPA